MTPAALRRDLLATREALLCRLQRPTADGRGNEGDRAAASIAAELSAYDAERIRARVQEIDRAIARMDAGTYGACVDCGADILPRRLEARPTVETCIECQEARERVRPVFRRPVADDEDAC